MGRLQVPSASASSQRISIGKRCLRQVPRSTSGLVAGPHGHDRPRHDSGIAFCHRVRRIGSFRGFPRFLHLVAFSIGNCLPGRCIDYWRRKMWGARPYCGRASESPGWRTGRRIACCGTGLARALCFNPVAARCQNWHAPEKHEPWHSAAHARSMKYILSHDNPPTSVLLARRNNVIKRATVRLLLFDYLLQPESGKWRVEMLCLAQRPCR